MISDGDEFIRALRPIVEALGASLVAEPSHRLGDLPGGVPIEWDGNTIGFVSGFELHGALDRLVAGVERRIGERLADMSRQDKQAAVRQLDQHGAFLLRGAVDDVANRMGVSRVTLYSYLNALNTPAR